ncbi:hypothetical protein VNI00_015492 [Paramarasmius palmivorus]|uniref:Uncharacterized protein n=1 Tax=Paramarasmius palmivorus TaxID=297713 RepID=A0AAW0BKN0_9AGAR
MPPEPTQKTSRRREKKLSVEEMKDIEQKRLRGAISLFVYRIHLSNLVHDVQESSRAQNVVVSNSDATRRSRVVPAYEEDASQSVLVYYLFYAEWVRRGMYRKTHAQEFEEQERKKSECAAKREKEKAIQAETERLERTAAEERKRKKHERNTRRKIGDGRTQGRSIIHVGRSFSPRQVPHRVNSDLGTYPGSAHRQKPEKKDILEDPISVSLDDLNRDAITSFLLLSTYDKERKDKLRETFLRFHPDKFEGRFLQRVRPDDQEKVRMGLASVVRVLNDLMGEGG